MHQALNDRRHEDRGFTLIELMIVVLIIGILIAVGLPSFLGARNRAQDRAAQAQLRNAMVAAKTWYTDANTFVDFNTSPAVAGSKGCPATLPAVPAVTGADSVFAMCVEPSIPWEKDNTFSTSSPQNLVYIKVATASEVCLVAVSANGPALWYASDSGSGTVIGLAGAANGIPATCDGAA